MHSQAFQEIVDFRRSNRHFDANTPVPDEVIQRSLERAALSPNSSNMQLWEFHWIKSKDALAQMVPLCLNQNAARSAQHQVVFVTRQDLWKSRAAWNLQQVQNSIQGEPNNGQKAGLRYYGKLMPFLYTNDPLGIMHGVRWLLGWVRGAFKPFYRPGGKAEQRIVAHKSCALAAQTFMLSVAAEGFHTCPMEGLDRVRVRKFLGLPRGAEINMAIAVGLGTEAGVWGPRFRVPLEQVVRVH